MKTRKVIANNQVNCDVDKGHGYKKHDIAASKILEHFSVLSFGVAFVVLIVLIRNNATMYILAHDIYKYSSYLDLLESWNEYLADLSLSIWIGDVQICFLDWCASMIVCHRYKEQIRYPKSSFEALMACTLEKFGGTTLTGLLLGQPPSWILSQTSFPALLLAFWLTFCCPSDIFWSTINKIPYGGFKFTMGLLAAISSGHAITMRGQDKAALNKFHVNSDRIGQSMLTCIACGTLSGSGGVLVTDILGLMRNPSFTLSATPQIFLIHNHGATRVLNRSLLLSCLYYFLTSSHHMPWEQPLLNRKTGHLVLGFLQVGHFLIQRIDPKVDIFQFVSESILHCLMVPVVIDPILQKKDSSQQQVAEVSVSGPMASSTSCPCATAVTNNDDVQLIEKLTAVSSQQELNELLVPSKCSHVHSHSKSKSTSHSSRAKRLREAAYVQLDQLGME